MIFRIYTQIQANNLTREKKNPFLCLFFTIHNTNENKSKSNPVNVCVCADSRLSPYTNENAYNIKKTRAHVCAYGNRKIPPSVSFIGREWETSLTILLNRKRNRRMLYTNIRLTPFMCQRVRQRISLRAHKTR